MILNAGKGKTNTLNMDNNYSICGAIVWQNHSYFRKLQTRGQQMYVYINVSGNFDPKNAKFF